MHATLTRHLFTTRTLGRFTRYYSGETSARGNQELFTEEWKDESDASGYKTGVTTDDPGSGIGARSGASTDADESRCSIIKAVEVAQEREPDTVNLQVSTG